MAGKPARLSIEIVSDAVSGVAGLNDTAAATDRVADKMNAASRAASTMDRAMSGVGHNASRSMDDVADSTDRLATKTGTATGAMGALAGGFEALGLGGVATGLQVVGVSTDFVSGSMDLLTIALESTRVKQIALTLASIKQAVVSKTVAAVTRTWTAVQWLLNVALSANPIGLVVLAVVALVAAIVLAYKKSDTFRAIVTGAFKAVSAAALFLWRNVFVPFGKFVGGAFVAYWNALSKGLSTVIGWFKSAIDWAAKLWDQLKKFVGGTVGKVLDLFSGSKGVSIQTGTAAATRTTGANSAASAGRAASITVDGRIGLRVAAPVVNVYLDGRRVRGLVSKVVTDALNADGARLATGGWS